MIRGHERAVFARTLRMLSSLSCLSCCALALTGCENSSPPMPTEAMARRQWELSVQQNRRDLEQHGAAASNRTELVAKDREIAKLKKENAELRERIVRIENDSKNDGRVIREFPDGMVWIDRGKDDELELKGVYRVLPPSGTEDERTRRSDIEIVRFLGPHLAEARVLDKEHPISIGDRVRTRDNSAAVADIPKVDPNEGEILSFELALEMVEISLGTREGLVKGELLHVYRQTPERQYLGQVRVLNAAPNKAFASVVGALKTLGVEPGDRVCRTLPEGLSPVAPRSRLD
jgi:hypothetical protein